MFDAYVTFQARLRPHAMALITPERWTTYAELEADVNRLAAALRNLGITPARGVVALPIRNLYLKHVALLALARLGVVSSPADDPDADLYLVDAEETRGPKGLALTGAWVAAALDAEPVPVAPVRGTPETITRVMLSSGTTKVSRRVARSWRVLEDNTRMAALTYLGGKTGRWVSMTGLDTGLGQGMTLAAWHSGATVVEGLNVQRLAAELDALQPTIIGLTPIFLRGLLQALPAACAVRPGLRLVTTGAVLSRPVALEARLRLSSDILITYGATECGSISMADGAWLETVSACAGYASPGVSIEVVDAEGAPVPAGEQGEVLIKSDRVAEGYLNDAEATERCFRNGGFYPGDMGRLAPDGMLVIDGRKDERMNFGGVKYLPNLLEDVAMTCPGVADCACFAVPDAQGIDQCWLAVVTGEGFDRARLAQMVAARPHVLPPVRFAWTEAIPRSISGKIERQKLRAETMAALGIDDPG